MKLIIHAIGLGLFHNIRMWEPENPDIVVELIRLDIGMKQRKGTDTFTIRVATPLGLSTLDDNDGIIAERPLLIMRHYDYNNLIKWVNKTVSVCEAETWSESVEKLRRYFNWEYDNYVEH